MTTTASKTSGRRHVGKPCTLDGKPAKVIGRAEQFATIAIIPDGYSCDFSWQQVERIMQAGGKFKAYGFQTEAPKPVSMSVTTTGTGYFKPGLSAEVVAIGQRTVYLGRDCVETIMPEFTLKFPNGGERKGCQLGRDFVLG